MSEFFDYSAGRLVFTVDLVLSNVADLYQALTRQDLTSVDQVDLSAVKKLDSAGIALLLELKQMAACLTLIQPPAHLSTLLALYNLEAQFHLVEESRH
ncbi:STAS domain-containing protein [Thiomicrospira microaerophila]|uniref:STAS domain-containing protein n=1 Tax=Thiomicrospira microaerophila TaxID=406020 RepID=UPI0005C8A0EB|nr:STAS domain-containing protein [Thiomicrospira microaerophila]